MKFGDLDLNEDEFAVLEYYGWSVLSSCPPVITNSDHCAIVTENAAVWLIQFLTKYREIKERNYDLENHNALEVRKLRCDYDALLSRCLDYPTLKDKLSEEEIAYIQGKD